MADYAHDPQMWPYLLAVGLCIGVTAFSWYRHAIPGARPLAAACFFALFWVAGAAAESMAVDPAAKVAWFKFQVAWQLPAVTAVTCFVLEYANPGRWLTRRTLVLLSIAPLLGLALVLTNNLHHWYWLGFSVGAWVVPLPGPGYWVLFAYGMGLMLVNLFAFAWLFVRSPRHRLPVALMLVGQFAARALHALDVAGGRAILGWDPFLPSIVVPLGMYAIALFGFRIFDPLPAAGRAAIEQMQEGMVVFDTGWRALSLNPAAAGILGIPAARARGKTWAELLPSCPDAGQCLGAGSIPIEVSFEDGEGGDATAVAGARRYTLALTPLTDHRAMTMGYLLLLHDVTEQRRAQAQLLEQQWTRATLQERELLAQELHDGLAQNLGFFNLQAQAATLYLRSGQAEAAQDTLERLTKVTLEMQDDTRELMGELLTVSLPSEGLCGAVRQAVTRFEKQTGLPVSLEMAEDLEAVCRSSVLPPAAGVQLLRILQESLANVRKHAGGPTHVGVQLGAEGGQLRMTIADNGTGFDPAPAGAGGKHFGLQVMAQRAERIGGQLGVHSAPGSGTRVEVCVPLGR